MKQHQKGEVMLAVMVVMMAVVWIVSGHMGMMEHGSNHAEKPEMAAPPQSSAPQESSEHKH